LGRFDDRDEELNNRQKPVSNLLTIFLVCFTLGFIAGAVWGYFYFESLVAQEAFAFEWTTSNNYTPTLSDTVSFGDEISVVVHSGTG